MDYVQINSGLIKADVAIATPQPSGVTLFSATDAPISPEFFVSTPLPEQYIAYLEWRILIQVVAMQINEMQTQPQPEPILWQARIKETLERVNAKGKIFKPQSIPSDIVPPTVAYRALSVTGNWCDTLTQQLTSLFSSVASVDTLKIEIYKPDAMPAKNDMASSNNLPVPLDTDNISILQEPTR